MGTIEKGTTRLLMLGCALSSVLSLPVQAEGTNPTKYSQTLPFLPIFISSFKH